MATQTIRYIGPHPAVEVPLPGGGEATVAHSSTFETTAEHAKSLLEQASNWEPGSDQVERDEAAKRKAAAKQAAATKKAKAEKSEAAPAAADSTTTAGEGGDQQ